MQNIGTASDVLTALVATTALIIALWQIHEIRSGRREASKPYVVAFLEPHAGNLSLVDLVVKNFGQTAAYDVRLEASPPLITSIGDGPNPVPLFDCLPVLVPGQSWTTLWDSGYTRKGPDYPLRYDINVTYRAASYKRRQSTTGVLDWEPLMIRTQVVHEPLDAMAKSLKDLSTTVKSIVKEGHLQVLSDDAVHRRRVRRAHKERTGEPVTDWTEAEAAYDVNMRRADPSS